MLVLEMVVIARKSFNKHIKNRSTSLGLTSLSLPFYVGLAFNGLVIRR